MRASLAKTNDSDLSFHFIRNMSSPFVRWASMIFSGENPWPNAPRIVSPEASWVFSVKRLINRDLWESNSWFTVVLGLEFFKSCYQVFARQFTARYPGVCAVRLFFPFDEIFDLKTETKTETALERIRTWRGDSSGDSLQPNAINWINDLPGLLESSLKVSDQLLAWLP